MYEGQPSYQLGVAGVSATQRSIPDLSFDADPATGVSVYDSAKCQGIDGGWLVLGGTSVSSPSLAAVVNRAMSFQLSSIDELTTMYTNRTNAADFFDITAGSAGPYSAGPGWDYVTGIGSPRGPGGK
jgi:kumamolisin